MSDSSEQKRSKFATVLGLLFVGTFTVGVIAVVGATMSWVNGRSELVPVYLIAAALGLGLSLRSVTS